LNGIRFKKRFMKVQNNGTNKRPTQKVVAKKSIP
jgi:hypothetical protein